MRELLTGYGKIDYLFYDFSYEHSDHREIWGGKGAADWGSEELLALTRELQPGILVNDRLDIPGDFVTPEQYQPAEPMEVDGRPVPWEACQTLNGSWGYFRDNQNDKPVDLLVRMLVDGVSKDGNLLLNVGPTARGNFDPRRRAGPGGHRRVDGPARPIDLRGDGQPVHAADRRPVHPAGQPAVRPHLQLAVRASPPARSRRQGRVRATAQRRLGDRLHASSTRRSAPRTPASVASRPAPSPSPCRSVDPRSRCRSSSSSCPTRKRA